MMNDRTPILLLRSSVGGVLKCGVGNPEKIGEGRFELLERVGEGRFAEVWRARDLERESVCAIKRFRVDFPNGANSLRAEFEHLSRVSHPGVVKAGVFMSGSEPFFTMEYLPGRSLGKWVRGDIEAPDEDALRANLPTAFGQVLQPEGLSVFQPCTARGLTRLDTAVCELADALVAIHQAGILHLDITPENVRVREDGRSCLLDFGLAMRREEVESGSMESKALVGSAAYMAPELGAVAPDEAADWYSLGVLLFFLLTGALPFDGTGADLLAKKRSMQAPGPSTLVEGIPERLERACMLWLRRSRLERMGRQALD